MAATCVLGTKPGPPQKQQMFLVTESSVKLSGSIDASFEDSFQTMSAV